MTVIEIKRYTIPIWAATTCSLYLESGVFSGSFGEMLTKLPFVLCNFKMSCAPASAAARNISAGVKIRNSK